MWGSIDLDEYEHNADPLNGDMHEVVPGKFLVFRAPQDLGGMIHLDHAETWTRTFAPEFYADVLPDYGVTSLVHLGDAHNSYAAFADRGIACHDLLADDNDP